MKIKLFTLFLFLSLIMIDCNNSTELTHIFEKTKWFCEIAPAEMLQNELESYYEKYHLHFYNKDLFTMKYEYRYTSDIYDEIVYDGYYTLSDDHTQLNLHISCPTEMKIEIYHVDGELQMDHGGRLLRFQPL